MINEQKVNELMVKLNELNNQKDKLEEEIKTKQDQVKELDLNMIPLKEELMSIMKENNLTEYCCDGLVTVLDSRKSTGYSKEEEELILQMLKDRKLLSCISLKESLAKRELNKELKSNAELKEALKSYGQEKVTEFVVVMTEENAKKREEHINGK